MGASFPISLLISLTVTMPEPRADEARLPAKIEFNRDIRPILSDACFHCHGPDKNTRESGLRLDFREEALKPAKSGEIPIMPGHPEKSDLVRRVLTDAADERMPPPKAHKVLATTQKEMLQRWIVQGAEYQPHWAFLPIQRPPVPALASHPVDRDRTLYAWRDWVIRAFNENQRFDQFAIEQIAGDLLPNATLDQRVATGFNRNHMINEEGGVTAEEFLANYAADRVETTSTVWFAQIFNCTRCHDHNATVLHLLGLDHTRLTVRHQGRDYRLTDVHGNLIRSAMA